MIFGLFMLAVIFTFLGFVLGVHAESKNASQYYEDGYDAGERIEKEIADEWLKMIEKLKLENEVNHQVRDKLFEYIKRYNNRAYCTCERAQFMTGEENLNLLYANKIVLPEVLLGFYSPYSSASEILAECEKIERKILNCAKEEE